MMDGQLLAKKEAKEDDVLHLIRTFVRSSVACKICDVDLVLMSTSSPICPLYFFSLSTAKWGKIKTCPI